MANRDLQELPKFEDNWSYLYFEYGCIDQHQKSIGLHYLDKVIPIPVETLSVIMLGPGTTITHEAIKRISDSRCLIAWTGEGGIRFYSAGYTGTYFSKNLLKQVETWADEKTRYETAKKMYLKRFLQFEDNGVTTIEQLRGMEGIRVRNIYQELAKEYGVNWEGRNYDQNNWNYSDPLNRALSSANACLYGIVHAAILALGFSPAIGFIHTGKQLSFVYDVADLYKTALTVPLAFKTAKESEKEIEKRVRLNCRDVFKENRIMKKIIQDLKDIFYGSHYAGEIYPVSEGRDVAVSY
ncbi:MAG TPA: type I-E CRISPR-associated endonuclease Cas1 [Spirochaetia bacterium]|nr:type I-E CRISPR-associated endonuclease Cas1 [Spirochaetia bacterium]